MLPVEFCSDVFLLPLYEPPVDSINMESDTYVRHPRPSPPTPPVRYLNPYHTTNPLSTLTTTAAAQSSYYEILVDKLEFNNNSYVKRVLEKSNPSELGNLLRSPTQVPKLSSSISSLPPPPPERQRLEPIFESLELEQYI